MRCCTCITAGRLGALWCAAVLMVGCLWVRSCYVEERISASGSARVTSPQHRTFCLGSSKGRLHLGVKVARKIPAGWELQFPSEPSGYLRSDATDTRGWVFEDPTSSYGNVHFHFHRERYSFGSGRSINLTVRTMSIPYWATLVAVLALRFVMVIWKRRIRRIPTGFPVASAANAADAASPFKSF
jgi:hypothetical protein